MHPITLRILALEWPTRRYIDSSNRSVQEAAAEQIYSVKYIAPSVFMPGIIVQSTYQPSISAFRPAVHILRWQYSVIHCVIKFSGSGTQGIENASMGCTHKFEHEFLVKWDVHM